jgi:CelD/BcsL family acetyltransferase involved in cellulose biosynthesis
LVGLLPLGKDESRPSRLSPVTARLSFLGEPEGAPDYLDILSMPGWEQKCADAIFGKLAESGGFDVIVLEGMLADSPTLPAASLRFGDSADFRYQITPQYACPRMALSSSWEETLGGTRRPDYFNYCMRRLNKLQGFEARTVSAPGEIEAAFERFLELHEDRWKDRGGSAATDSSELKGFMGDAALSLAEAGRMRFEELWIEGRCRASLFGIEGNESYYFYLSGFDQSWSKYSLGFVIVGISIRGAVQRGLKRYDFLRGAETYKFDWANQTALTVSAEIVGNSRAARLLVAQNSAKELARALVPERVKALRRRARQLLKPAPAAAPPVKQNPDPAAKPEGATQTSDLYSLPR